MNTHFCEMHENPYPPFCGRAQPARTSSLGIAMAAESWQINMAAEFRGFGQAPAVPDLAVPSGGLGRPGTRRFGRGFGEGRGRMFDAGDIKLVILRLCQTSPVTAINSSRPWNSALGAATHPVPA